MVITVLAEKIVGAAAEEGKDLATCADLCRRVNAEGTGPAAGKPTFELGDNEMEIGIGIHGEPGRERLPLEPARDIVRRLAGPILEDLPYASGDRVLAFVNGMGGTPMLELYLVYNELRDVLAEHGVEVARSLIGPYITSLEMAGCSITLLRMDDEMIRLWDAPVHAPGLRWGA